MTETEEEIYARLQKASMVPKYKESHQPKETKKLFSVLVDFGTISAPCNYDHENYLDNFQMYNRGDFHYGYHDKLTDSNFSNPSRIILPGDTFHVIAFSQEIFTEYATMQESLDFLKKQGSVFVGAQGAGLLWLQKRRMFPRVPEIKPSGELYELIKAKERRSYLSFDDPERLFFDDNNVHRIPEILIRANGDFGFGLAVYERGFLWPEDYILGFFEV